MAEMITNSEKSDALDRILKSKTLSKSTTTNVLLKFIVECTLAGKNINAYTIGMELLGAKYDPDKSDVNIRVNTSHLRKRLKQYYETEGASDPVHIAIEPGQYLASFTPLVVAPEAKSQWPFYSAGALILLLLMFFAFNHRGHDKVWSPIFDNDLETTLYLGDVFGYRAINAFGQKGWQRDSRINSVEEFYDLVAEDTEKYKELAPSNYSYVVSENAFTIKPFTQYFLSQDYDFSLALASNFMMRSIKERNTIYAGPVFSQTVFCEMFNELSNNVTLKYGTWGKKSPLVTYRTAMHEKKTINFNARYPKGEYTLASGFNGPNSTRHYIFMSNHGMGLSAVVDYFANTDSVQAFSERYMQESDEFVALFFVAGKERTDLSMEIVFVDDNR